MMPHRGLHHRLLGKRQDLGGVLGGFVPPAHGSTPGTTSSANSDNQGDPSGFDGIFGGFSSLIDNIPSLFVPSSGPSTATTTTPLTSSSSSSTGSTTTPTSSAPTTTSTSRTASSASIPSTTPTPTPTPTPTSTPSISDTIYTSSDGTRVVYVTNTQPAASPTTAHSTSFLQDPSLEGGVFTLVGLVVLVIAFIAITCAIRKRRRSRLERDLASAVTFDPGAVDQYERQENSVEKHRLSGSSSGHGHGRDYGYGYGTELAYAAQQDYHGAVGYGQYPAAMYRTPSTSAQYRVPSPTVPQPAVQGGANLKRKFSDRKPVPPLLIPSHDPSNTHVSVPSQLYYQ